MSENISKWLNDGEQSKITKDVTEIVSELSVWKFPQKR